jgi:hypothetical protein
MAPQRLLLLVALAACRPNGAAVRQPDPLTVGLGTISAERLARDVAVLSSDPYAGRFPGSPGEARTLAYVSSALARAGVEPAGDDFLQAVPLVGVTPRDEKTITANVGGERRDARGELLVGVARPQVDVDLPDCPVVFAGYGIDAPEHGWNDYEGVDVAGKIVVVLGGEPPQRRPDDSRFDGPALSYHGTPKAKQEAGGRRGAVAVFTLFNATVGVSWDVLSKNGSETRYKLADAAVPAALKLTGSMRPDLLERLAGGAEVIERWTADAATGNFRARTLAGATLSIRAGYELKPLASHNVVGVIRGRERPDEYVLYVAHWDHVGHNPKIEGDSIFNGAVDNATGTAALLSLAHAFGALPRPPARSVVFLATTAEEQGLLGAWHYVDHPVFPLRATVGVINMDALFPFGATKGMTVVGLGSSELERYIEDAARTVGRKAYGDPSPEFGAYFRSDHYPFADAGVPAVFAIGGPAQDPGAGETVDTARFEEYVTRRYHQPTDEYDAKTWDMAGIVQDVSVYFRAGYTLAQDTAFPNWRPDHAFRARRDAMRASG